MKMYDSIIIGGGPAGLSAAIYLARFQRSVLMIDDFKGRSAGLQINENYLGFPQGIKARKLVELGKKQAQKFGAEIVLDSIRSVSLNNKRDKHIFKLKGDKNTYQAKSLILANGVKDMFPSFPGAKKFIGKSIFWCLMCDAWKLRNKEVLVVGFEDKAPLTCFKLLNYTTKISLLTNCPKGEEEFEKSDLDLLKKYKIKVFYGSIKKVTGIGGMLKEVVTDNDEKIKISFIMSKLGYTPRSDIARELGAIIESRGFIQVDKEQHTSIPFLYAAGDVTGDVSHQILTAAHQGAVAAATLNEDLLLPFQKED